MRERWGGRERKISEKNEFDFKILDFIAGSGNFKIYDFKVLSRILNLKLFRVSDKGSIMNNY